MSDDLLATRRFKALTDEWTFEELGRFLGLTPEDMQEVRLKSLRTSSAESGGESIWLR